MNLENGNGTHGIIHGGERLMGPLHCEMLPTDPLAVYILVQGLIVVHG